MTLPEETLRLGDELDRLDTRQDELRAQFDSAEGEAADYYSMAAEGVDARGRGVAYLVDEYGADATVTIQGLTAGAFARVEDRVQAVRNARPDDAGAPGAHRNIFAATALVAAPFLDGDAYEDKIEAVSDQPPGVAKWLYRQADRLTTVDSGNWKSFNERRTDN